MSDCLNETVCHKCGAKGLDAIHCEVGKNCIISATTCKKCRAKDVIRFDKGEFGRIEDEETAEVEKE